MEPPTPRALTTSTLCIHQIVPMHTDPFAPTAEELAGEEPPGEGLPSALHRSVGGGAVSGDGVAGGWQGLWCLSGWVGGNACGAHCRSAGGGHPGATPQLGYRFDEEDLHPLGPPSMASLPLNMRGS
eukprot:scaffold13252_cov101-Isochrysis_galbana.AAC.3